MKFQSVSAALAILFSLALVKADDYANFFDDSACSVNGGIGVDIYNDGCLAEGGRGSVYIPAASSGSLDNMCLVKTASDGTCSCQSEGYNFTPTGFCAVLDPTVQSYRFINQACAANNC
ncbi:hypothetical protein P7C73_g576, partial [Tremellales sp. Uapishka_1]